METSSGARGVAVRALFLLTLVAAVALRGLGGPAVAVGATESSLTIIADLVKLPLPVREMREAILEAARSGRIEALREPIEMNELKPDMGQGVNEDPIDHLRGLSRNGEGRDVLLGMIAILEQPAAVRPGGPGPARYIWPYLAELPLSGLVDEHAARLDALVPPGEASAMRISGRWLSFRLVIGADGTWHSFRKEP